MSKRNNITYVKPQEPSFLAKLKAEIGYKEGPTVDTKRQKLEDSDQDQDQDQDYVASEERPEREDEKPQIVVLSSGDLTADEVALEQQRIAKEEAERPADLSQPIVFKQRVKQPTIKSEKDSTDKSQKSANKRKKSKASGSSKLSFNEDEEDNEAGED